MSSDFDRHAIKQIVIAGGGTAGWMAAISLASRFPDKRITVIDSKAIAAIGVGESATGVVFEFLSQPKHGLSWGEFFRHCDPTFKLGIRFTDWQGVGTEYLGPIDGPARFRKHDYPRAIEEAYAAIAAQGMRLGDMQLYSHLMRSGRTDIYRNADGSVNHGMVSCHFDALAFAKWLSDVAATRSNITHLDDIVEGVTQNPQTGHVTALRTRSGRNVAGEFFIDCTGFHRLLLAKVYQPKWRSYADYIRVDRAIPRQTQYAAGQNIPTYTLSAAMPNGWKWEVPTQTRMGNGYIYSSRYVSDEQAVAEFRAAGVDSGDSPTILRFAPGRFEQQWMGNVCSIGLSGAFSEPLEATTIHGISVQIKILTELLLPHATTAAMPSLAATYNRLIGTAYDDYVDFINFHYHGGRTDTEFWRDYQKPDALTPANQARLEKWHHAFPSHDDFAPIHTDCVGLTTNFIIWAPMLCAFGLLRPDAARRVVQNSLHGAELKENVERYIWIRNYIIANSFTQAESIAYFRNRPG